MNSIEEGSIVKQKLTKKEIRDINAKCAEVLALIDITEGNSATATATANSKPKDTSVKSKSYQSKPQSKTSISNKKKPKKSEPVFLPKRKSEDEEGFKKLLTIVSKVFQLGIQKIKLGFKEFVNS